MRNIWKISVVIVLLLVIEQCISYLNKEIKKEVLFYGRVSKSEGSNVSLHF